MLILAVPILIIIFFLASIILLFLKKYTIGITSLLISLLLNIYTETFALSFFNYNSNENQVRILTYNIGLNSPYFKNKSDSLQGIINFFKQQNADIVILPESRIWNKNKLRDALNRQYSYSMASAYQGKEKYVETFVYSQYPLSNIHQIGNNYIYTMDVELPNHKISKLVACHLSSNQNHSSLSKENGFFKNLSNGYKKRNMEVQELCDSLKNWKGPILICGDFNDLSGSTTLQLLQKRNNVKDAWWNGGIGYGTTFYGKHLRLRLDHILYSESFSLSSVNIPHINFSDHYPVVANFNLQ